jgi:ABC-type multidrug transport system ATPase subunit
VLFLDEPTTGLDPQGRLELWDVIRGLVSDGTTVLLTTQYLEEADKLADHIVVVDHGRIIAEGTPADLKARVGSTMIEIGLADEGEAVRAKSVLAPFSEDLEPDGRIVRLRINDGARVLIDVLRALDAAQLTPATMAVREPSLDDAFLALTGRQPERAEALERQPAVVGGPR